MQLSKIFDWLKLKLVKLKKRVRHVSSIGGASSNIEVQKRQKLRLMLIVSLFLLIIISLFILNNKREITGRNISSKISKENDGDISNKMQSSNKLELADSGLDTERRWRDHLESIIEQQNRIVEERLRAIEEKSESLNSNAERMIAKDIEISRQKMEQAQMQMREARDEFSKITAKEAARQKEELLLNKSELTRQRLGEDIEFDQPKSVSNYIPEGTYFTGRLLGGIAVSTALSTADEHATPVIIRLQERGNLHDQNKLNIGQCRIMGSAYGDLSSERAIIRLEKLICEVDNMYHTSKIAGQVFGPDGLNGIKGRVVDTSNKHVKNIILSGMISGLASSVKNSDYLMLANSDKGSLGKRNIGNYFNQGVSGGVGNAGEKIANYFLKQAEAMSPILTIDAGVKIDVQITRGFYFGEVGTHRRIKQLRK